MVFFLSQSAYSRSGMVFLTCWSHLLHLSFGIWNTLCFFFDQMLVYFQIKFSKKRQIHLFLSPLKQNFIHH